MSDRDKKLNHQIKKVISEFLRLEFGANPLVSITNFFVAQGLKSAKANITVFPESAERRVLYTLSKKQKNLRGHIMLHTRMKYIPFVSFEIDCGEKNRRRIDELLQER